MPDVTIIYWRDIPAQVLVGSGRKAVKRELSERFQVAIDAAAMKAGARETDAYLADWHKAAAGSHEGEPDAIVATVAAKIEADYDKAKLRALIEAGGRAG
jgi:hypothetical protein